MVANFIPELILAVFQFLPLRSLFAARAVNRTWRNLVAVTDMVPERRALYDLYFAALASPTFLASRTFTLPYLVPFNRTQYIARLEEPGTLLPHEFRCWILEWPEKAVFGWSWPGLDAHFDYRPQPWKRYGSNSIQVDATLPDSPPPKLEPLIFYYPVGANPHPTDTDEIKAKYWDNDLLAVFEDMTDPDDEITMSRGLQIWYHGCTCYTWLIVDNHKPLLHGTLHYLDGYRSYRDKGQVAVGWVAWLKAALDESDRKYLHRLD